MFFFLELLFFSDFFSSDFSGRFATSGYILPLLVPEIEGGYPERDGGEEEEEEEEGQFLQYSSRLIW